MTSEDISTQFSPPVTRHVPCIMFVCVCFFGGGGDKLVEPVGGGFVINQA